MNEIKRIDPEDGFVVCQAVCVHEAVNGALEVSPCACVWRNDAVVSC